MRHQVQIGDNIPAVTLAQGSGGLQTGQLIERVFRKHFFNEILEKSDDAAVLALSSLPGYTGGRGKLAFTTDSFVVTPLFFKGGNIGKLSICGTINDLAAVGASPLLLSCGFIIEEGFPMGELEEIVSSMAETCAECGAKVVAGDTKVVPKGSADGLYINTSGIGIIPDSANISGSGAQAGDILIVTGTIGEHGLCIMLERDNMGLKTDMAVSDCAPLCGLVSENGLGALLDNVGAMRDPTRGGVAAALNEIASSSGIGIVVNEKDVPVAKHVSSVCGLLGLDPLSLACEGRMLVFVRPQYAQEVLKKIRSIRYCEGSCVIGEAVSENPGFVSMRSMTGGRRIIDMPSGEQLPRIC